MLASSKWPIRPIGEMMPVGTSPAARFQAVQTRARMGAALWSRALRVPLSKETGQSIIATAINATKPFQHLPHSKEEAGRSWSAREWTETRKGWIFLPSSAASQAAIQSLQGVWLDVLTRWLMSAEIRS